MANAFITLASEYIPEFDELYSISDLHMGGGRPGSQIFDSGHELAALIKYVQARKAGRVALLINGDLVDFLAEDDAVAFDPAGAVGKLKRIVGDPSFKPAWEALQEFIRKKGRYLIVTLGNHDLELALPWVRAQLLNLLANDDEAARGRITLAFDGAGFLCRVGNATVLGVHGNEVDDWNLTDHERIRRFGMDIQQRRAVEAWIPNAGTQLVINAMNDIKKDYPFVDLLKPELEGVIPTLLAVAPEKKDRISAAFPVAGRLYWDKLRRATGFLGADDERDGRHRLSEQERDENQKLVSALYRSKRMNRDALLAETERRFAQGTDPMMLIGSDQRGGYLGMRSAVVSLVTGEDPSEALRKALDGLQKDRSFVWSQEDDTFHQLDERMGEVDFILAGHTHLERALPRHKHSGCWYLNSGTWARLIKLEPRVLGSKTEFAQVYQAFTAKTMEALDAIDGLVLRPRTVIAVRPNGSGTRGELLHCRLDGDKLVLDAVDPGAGFTKS